MHCVPEHGMRLWRRPNPALACSPHAPPHPPPRLTPTCHPTPPHPAHIRGADSEAAGQGGAEGQGLPGQDGLQVHGGWVGTGQRKPLDVF